MGLSRTKSDSFQQQVCACVSEEGRPVVAVDLEDQEGERNKGFFGRKTIGGQRKTQTAQREEQRLRGKRRS